MATGCGTSEKLIGRVARMDAGGGWRVAGGDQRDLALFQPFDDALAVGRALDVSGPPPPATLVRDGANCSYAAISCAVDRLVAAGVEFLEESFGVAAEFEPRDAAVAILVGELEPLVERVFAGALRPERLAHQAEVDAALRR